MTAITKTRTYNEVQTAEILGVQRATLRLWRLAGKLVDGLVLTGVKPAPAVTYDADLVDAFGDGHGSPFAE